MSKVPSPAKIVAKGLAGVVATGTARSDVLGLEGKLIYRGYDIDELAGKVTFEEAAYLLWEGDPKTPKPHKNDKLIIL